MGHYASEMRLPPDKEELRVLRNTEKFRKLPLSLFTVGDLPLLQRVAEGRRRMQAGDNEAVEKILKRYEKQKK